MISFTILIAEKRIAIAALYESTKEFCKEYLCEGTPDFTVTISQEDINFEREKSIREDIIEGIPVRYFPDDYLETLAVYRKIAEQIIQFHTFLFHGSVIAVDGVGYLFTAKSGTGKSTHTRLWREVFGSRAFMVNDDKPLLHVAEDGVYAYGTPWDGKHHLSTNCRVPLAGICILERGETNRIVQISGKEALQMLMQQSHRPANPMGLAKLLSIMDELTKKMSFYRLNCNMDKEAAIVAYEGMQRKES